MKKIDKLIIQAFFGPFILTFAVVVFILLTVQMMNYVDQIFGKNLSYIDLGILVMHFAIFQTPIAFPLSVMLASLMTFGNLGEHFELTAIKGAGISLVRALQPIFIIVVIVTVIAFFSNNYLVPHSALKAYSLLYDIRQKKPALDIEPGLFYGGIENYKIKVDKKLQDGKTLLGVIIYNHTDKNGNKEVTVADSGKMYTILNDQYLKFELFNGAHYTEERAKPVSGRLRDYQQIGPFTRTFFQKSEIIFDLSSFGMSRTDEGLFASNRLMRNFNQLSSDLDSLSDDISLAEGEVFTLPERYFTYSGIKKHTVIPEEIVKIREREDSIRMAKSKLKEEENPAILYGQKQKEVPKEKEVPKKKEEPKEKVEAKKKTDGAHNVKRTPQPTGNTKRQAQIKTPPKTDNRQINKEQKLTITKPEAKKNSAKKRKPNKKPYKVLTDE